MPATTEKSALLRGALSTLPFVIVLVPFALLFGVVATEAGLNVAETMGFSVLVIAGAAQFTAIQLMSENAPVWIVLAASLGVNLRMAMYSAALQPHLGELPLRKRAFASYTLFDQNFATASVEFEDSPDQTVLDRYLFLMGGAIPMFPLWISFTWIGAVAGDLIPEWLELDFALPILFLAIVAPMLKTLAHLGAAFTSIVVALLLGFLPSGTGVLLAGLCAMAVGAEIERRRGR